MSGLGMDGGDPSRYDLVLNLGQMKVESAKRLIVEAAKLEEYQPTVTSERQFQDLSLSTRVHAVDLPSEDFCVCILGVRGKNAHAHVSENAILGVGRASRPRGRKSSRRD